MSYILKALKRADQERRQGRAPGLADGPPLELPPLPAKRIGWAVLGGGLLVCAVVALVIWWARMPWRIAAEGPLGQIASVVSKERKPAAQEQPAPQAGPEAAAPSSLAPAPAKPAAGAASTPAAKPTPTQLAPPSAPASADAPAADGPPRAPGDFRRGAQKGPGGPIGRRFDPRSRDLQSAEPGPGRRRPSGAAESPLPAESAVVPEPTPTPESTAAAAAPTEPPAPAMAAPQPVPADSESKAQASRDLTEQLARVAPASARENTVPDWRELPLETRKAIPEMKFSMLIYSEQSAERLLSINGKVLREGATVEPDLTLLEITQDGAIFRYKTTTFHKGVF